MATIAGSVLEACLSSFKQKSFTAAYKKTFDVVRADDETLKDKAYRLRYDVYCHEYGCEKPSESEYHMERDRYDQHAVHHLLIHKSSHDVAGTLRVILPDEADPGHSFPIQDMCDHPLIHTPQRAARMCEISRFCMAANFRKRPEDGIFLSSYSGQDSIDSHIQGMMTFMRRKIAYTPAGLLRGAFETALRHNLSECLWLVEPQHLPSLKLIGLPYHTLGPKFDYFGTVQPIIFNIKHALDHMRLVNPYCWDVISDEGRVQAMADDSNYHGWQDGLIDDDCRQQILERLL